MPFGRHDAEISGQDAANAKALREADHAASTKAVGEVGNQVLSRIENETKGGQVSTEGQFNNSDRGDHSDRLNFSPKRKSFLQKLFGGGGNES